MTSGLEVAPGRVPEGEAERILREQKAFYKDLVEAQPRGIYRLRVRPLPPLAPQDWQAAADAAYTVEFVSTRFSEITGIDPASLGSKPGSIADLVVPDDRGGFVAGNAEAVARCLPFRWEGRLVVNGRVRCIRFESIPRLLEDGDTVWTGTVEDVTESRQAEERRRESEALFRSFFEMPLVGACITSPTKGWLEVNDQLCRMLGYTREELASMTWASLTHTDDLDADVTRFEKVVRGEIDGYSLEKRFLRKDGSVVPVHLSVSCVRTGDGAVDYFVALLQDITERKKVEEELRTHREHLEALVAERTAELDRQRQLLDETSRLARVGGWEYDVRKAELTWTDAVREIHEVEPGFRMTVENGLGFYAPESRPVIAELLARAISTGEPFDAEVQLDTAKGRRVWVRAIGRAYVEDGKVVRVGGVLQDIDARRSAEEDLRRHRAHLEELVAERTAELEKSRSRLVEAQAVAHLGSWEWHVARNEIWGSDELFRLFDVSPGDLATLEQFFGLVHADDREEARRAVSDALGRGGGALYRSTYRIGRRDGRVRHVSNRGVVSADERGRPWKIVGTSLDITELKDAEDALKESENRFRRIVSESPFPIGLYAEDGEILLVNRAWCLISGYSPEELRTIDQWSEKAYGERRDAARADLESRFTLAESVREGEFGIRTKDGGRRFWDFSTAPLGRLPDGRRIVTTTAMDVTDRRLAEEELWAYRTHLEELVHARTSELEAANRELESFSYSVSHDLRAPLRALDGFSAALLDEYPDRLDEKGHHYLGRIRAAARKMASLIDGLLNLSRLKRLELSLVPVDVSRLATSVAADLLALEPGRAVQVVVAEGMRTEGDPRLLHVVLENLIGNALKFTSKRSGAVIEVGCAEADGQKAYFVKDNGVGFDMAQAAKLFEPFQRLHGVDDFPGTGIGLATVQRIVARHGGRIWPEASPGAGATFFFTLGSDRT
ncbi:MAG: PAS domain S-box protein [Holophagales bacterium]|nr:PAS domain S-box protein [Holophagales bacterium]